jgi:general secretion pathway protein J
VNTTAICRKTGGFTLLEVLLAIFIFAIIVSALYGAYTSTLNIADSTETGAEISNKARTALNRISADLQSLYLDDGSFFRCQKPELSGNTEDPVQFTSTAHILFTKEGRPVDFAVIGYRIQRETGTQSFQLYRIDLPYRPGDMTQAAKEEKGFLLCDGLRDIRFRYYDRQGTEIDAWQSVKKAGQDIHLPAMVEIELSFPDSRDPHASLTFKTAVALPAIPASS